MSAESTLSEAIAGLTSLKNSPDEGGGQHGGHYPQQHRQPPPAETSLPPLPPPVSLKLSEKARQSLAANQAQQQKDHSGNPGGNSYGL